MNIGIVGLGLIGGSFAKSIKEKTQHRVYGANRTRSVVLAAKMIGAVDDALDEQSLPLCDVVIISTYPAAVVEYIRANRERFKDGAIVVDCSGVKRALCGEIHAIAEGARFTFVGGHPMAGTQYSGLGASSAHLFDKATMLLTPYDETPISVREQARDFFLEAGFKKVHFTTPGEHDRKIAYTSQLPHIISNAYVKSPADKDCADLAAGSYRDLTRVAKLNAPMWTELFLANADNLGAELRGLIANLMEYADALDAGDAAALEALMRSEG